MSVLHGGHADVLLLVHKLALTEVTHSCDLCQTHKSEAKEVCIKTLKTA